jgi:hypothetical protein
VKTSREVVMESSTTDYFIPVVRTGVQSKVKTWLEFWASLTRYMSPNLVR